MWLERYLVLMTFGIAKQESGMVSLPDLEVVAHSHYPRNLPSFTTTPSAYSRIVGRKQRRIAMENVSQKARMIATGA